jgi:hypothetical protein
MNSRRVLSWRGWCIALGLALIAAMPAAQAAAPEAGSAPALRARHEELAGRLAQSPLGRPIQLDSAETADGVEGDVYAVVDHSLGEVRDTLGGAPQWCGMLLLHIDNRRCVVSRQPGGDVLRLSVVRRYDKPVEQAFELPFIYRIASATSDYLAMDLSAATGPLGTRNYRVLLEAIPLGDRRTFLHLGYAYDHNMMARLATMAYLATFGSLKVGFTETGRAADGRPAYIHGLRGLVERNAMRYFLTLDAYLDGAAAPPAERFETRLHRWYASVEQYPLQLHEVDLDTYLALKREDRRRDGAAAR